jgi:UDP-glucose 4-epimerase
MTKVLITGGLGYIGSRIAVFLATIPGYQVSVTTRKKAVETAAYKIPNNIQVINEANADGTAMQKAISNTDLIIHLAALNEIDSVKRPVEAIKVNVLNSYQVLEQAIQHAVKRFIYFSTAHVYGTPLTGTISEKTIPRPVHPYALTHRAFEDFVTAASDSKKISSVVIRLSNSFGPPAFNSADRWTLLVNDLCKQAAITGTMTLKTAGLQQRDFITLQDVCRAVKHFMDLPAEHLNDGIFNLGGNTSMSIIDMAKLVQERFKKVTRNEVVLSAPAPSEQDLKQDYSLHFNIDKLRSTGFALENDISKEIDDTIMFCTQFTQ